MIVTQTAELAYEKMSVKVLIKQIYIKKLFIFKNRTSNMALAFHLKWCSQIVIFDNLIHSSIFKYIALSCHCVAFESLAFFKL